MMLAYKLINIYLNAKEGQCFNSAIVKAKLMRGLEVSPLTGV